MAESPGDSPTTDPNQLDRIERLLGLMFKMPEMHTFTPGVRVKREWEDEVEIVERPRQRRRLELTQEGNEAPEATEVPMEVEATGETEVPVVDPEAEKTEVPAEVPTEDPAAEEEFNRVRNEDLEYFDEPEGGKKKKDKDDDEPEGGQESAGPSGEAKDDDPMPEVGGSDKPAEETMEVDPPVGGGNSDGAVGGVMEVEKGEEAGKEPIVKTEEAEPQVPAKMPVKPSEPGGAVDNPIEVDLSDTE
jgi:hypothetical protein